MQTVAVVNQKGGVAKTTTAVNLAATFATKGLRVLLVDQDPQCNTTAFFAQEEEPIPPSRTLLSLYQKTLNGKPDIIRPTRIPGLSLAPGHNGMAGISWLVGGLLKSTERLSLFLERSAPGFDLALIDTQPDLSVYTVNALMAADWYLVPMAPERMAVDGYRQLEETVEMVGQCNEKLRCLGVLCTLFDGRTSSHRDWEAAIVSQFDALYLGTIHASADLRAAADQRRAILERDKRCRAHVEYLGVARKIASRMGVPQP